MKKNQFDVVMERLDLMEENLRDIYRENSRVRQELFMLKEYIGSKTFLACFNNETLLDLAGNYPTTKEDKR